VSGAIERCKAGRASMRRYHPAAAFCAYVALDRGLRFGRRSDDEALAKQLLGDAGDSGGDWATLATAAQDVLAGQPAKARGPVGSLAQKSPKDLDIAAVAGDVELADKGTGKAAVAAWTQAAGIKKSPRTLFGLARAQLAAGDAKSAEATARAVIAAAPAHAGARMLLASILWRDLAREADALAFLKQVTDPGAVSKAASEGELVDAFTLTGNIHLARSRMSAAEPAFAAALKINPLAVKALIGNGELLFRSSRFSEALARFEAASNADADSIVAKVGMAKTYISLERMKEAKDTLKKLREARPGEPLVSLWLGHAEEVLNNKKEAEAAYIEAIKVGGDRPEAVDAYVALSRLLSGVGRNDDANAKLAEAAKKFPDSAALNRAKGEVALQMGRYDEAKRELEAALAKEEDLRARFALGVTLRHQRRFVDATAIFDKVEAVDKDFPGLSLERGVVFEETGQSERALQSYKEALAKAPKDIDLKLHVASTQVRAGHAKDAEPLLVEVRNARPNSAEANHFLGRALLARGANLAEAMRYLELAANLDNNRAEYWLYVGWAANEMGQANKAAPALNKALELDHDLADAYWQRGVLLQNQGQTEDALRDLNTALEKRPDRFQVWATIAMCDQAMQKWPEADKAWRLAIAKDDKQAEWHYRFGKLLNDHGNKAQVLLEMQKAVDLASQPDAPHYAWLWDAYFLLAEQLHRSPANKARAIEAYQKVLELAPAGIIYRQDSEKALASMGVRINR
jgi:tetratricopeptide (TPR) repeat protein